MSSFINAVIVVTNISFGVVPLVTDQGLAQQHNPRCIDDGPPALSDTSHAIWATLAGSCFELIDAGMKARAL